MTNANSLLTKYNIPGPRYTSYPTVPYWDSSDFSQKKWTESVTKVFDEKGEGEGISLYIHLPYCESLCTFCGCNKRITKNHQVEMPYISTVLKEWGLYLRYLRQKPVIKEIHLGGGTPTFFSPENLKRLIDGIMATAERHPQASFGFEGHPNNTTYQHLKTLRDIGFTRVSYGIQDFDPVVQDAINRRQTFDKVKQVTTWSRELGYTSVNFDLVYGLPFQTTDSVKHTIGLVNQLSPDRVAFYSYAHVPWIKGNGQRKFSDTDLPKENEKRALYELGRNMLAEMGLIEIGMDHFSTEKDDLFLAFQNGTLHRNFMGYTPFATHLLIGLGVSAIGDSWYGFAQNHKDIETYEEAVLEGELPVFRGHTLSHEDLLIRKHVLELMCSLKTRWPDDGAVKKAVLDRLYEPICDHLVETDNEGITVTPRGMPFIRNICMAFDLRLWRNQPQTRLFSMTI